jgi:hypothetical protein
VITPSPFVSKTLKCPSAMPLSGDCCCATTIPAVAQAATANDAATIRMR